MAERRRLPDLRPQLRRLGRRRRRRPARHPLAPRPTCATSASTRSGSRPSTPRPAPTTATTCPTTWTSIRASARSRTSTRSSPTPTTSGSASSSTSSRTTPPTSTSGSGTRSPTRSHPDRARYMFRPGVDGGPPTGWTSVFGGSAWTLDEGSGAWYLHFFAPDQPDLDWHNATVQRDFEDVLRFWLDRGVDGFRIDVAQALFKDQSLRRDGGAEAAHLARRLGDRREPAGAPSALPALARARGRVPGRADVRGRDRAREPGDGGGVRPAGRAAPRLQLRTPLGPVGRGRRCGPRSTPRSRPSAPSARPRPGCSRTTTCRACRRGTATASRARGARGPPRCCCWRCPARPSSTRARSSGSRRSTCPTSCARTRCSSAARARARAATAVASRSRGRGTARVRLHDRRAVAADARSTGARRASRRRPATRARCSSCTARRWPSGPRATSSGWRAPAGTLVFRRGDVVVPRQRRRGRARAARGRARAVERGRVGRTSSGRRGCVGPTRLIAHFRERAAARIRILRLLPAAGPRLLALAVALQVFAGVVPVAFIVATSAVVGRVPDAVEGGLDSPAWDSLQNALLVASVLFLLLHVSLAVQWTVSRAVEWAVDESVPRRGAGQPRGARRARRHLRGALRPPGRGLRVRMRA